MILKNLYITLLQIFASNYFTCNFAFAFWHTEILQQIGNLMWFLKNLLSHFFKLKFQSFSVIFCSLISSQNHSNTNWVNKFRIKNFLSPINPKFIYSQAQRFLIRRCTSFVSHFDSLVSIARRLLVRNF